MMNNNQGFYEWVSIKSIDRDGMYLDIMINLDHYSYSEYKKETGMTYLYHSGFNANKDYDSPMIIATEESMENILIRALNNTGKFQTKRNF